MLSAQEMVREVARSVEDRRVLEAMFTVPRERFVPAESRDLAYDDAPLPIGAGQTISQPTMVGIMTEALELTGTEHVLEVGTGSGYQAAILALLAHDVVSVELIDMLRIGAAQTLIDLGIDNVLVLPAGPVLGCPEHAPYDRILVTAGAAIVPPPLVEQLKVGGRLVIPVGDRRVQVLTIVTRTERGTDEEQRGFCSFVPLVGAGGLG